MPASELPSQTSPNQASAVQVSVSEQWSRTPVSNSLLRSGQRDHKSLSCLWARSPVTVEVAMRSIECYFKAPPRGKQLVTRSPAIHYALSQCMLTCSELHHKMRNRSLRATAIREALFNLMHIQLTLGKRHSDVPLHMAELIKTFVDGLEDLDRQLSELSGLMPVNYQPLLRAVSLSAVKAARKMDFISFTKFIPKMKDFEQSMLLGKGAFGSVYKAHFRDQLTVAVKLVPQARFRSNVPSDAMFMDKLIASVVPNHPYICRIFASYVAIRRSNGGQIFVTMMEYISGVELGELLSRCRTMDMQLSRKFLQQLMLAIEHLHFCGFLHRDVKPANVLVTRQGRLKLIDVDVSKLCIGLFGGQHLTTFFARTAYEFRRGEKVGTEAYMAPEVHLSAPFGRASDWWSVGVVFFRMTYGRLPFRGLRISQEIIQNDIDWASLSALQASTETVTGNQVQDFIVQLLQKNPRRRLGSKLYAELFEHPMFGDIDWQQSPNSSGICSDAFDAAGHDGMFSSSEGNVVSPVLRRSTLKRCEPSALNELRDQSGTPLRIMTFTSTLIKRMIRDDSPFSVTSPAGMDNLEDDAVDMRHYADLRVWNAEDTCSQFESMESDPEPLGDRYCQVALEYSSNGWFRKRSPLTLRRLQSEDGIYRFLVKGISQGVRIISQSKLFQGDLIIEISRVNIDNFTMDRTLEMLREAESPLVLTVYQENPFRAVGEARFSQKSLNRYGQLDVQWRGGMTRCCRRGVDHGITVRIKEVYTTGVPEPVCLVESHDLDTQRIFHSNFGAAKVYAGDIVSSINGSPIARIQNLDKEIHEWVLQLKVYTTSPLRRYRLASSRAKKS